MEYIRLKLPQNLSDLWMFPEMGVPLANFNGIFHYKPILMINGIIPSQFGNFPVHKNPPADWGYPPMAPPGLTELVPCGATTSSALFRGRVKA